MSTETKDGVKTKVKIRGKEKVAEIPRLKLPADPRDLINMYDLRDRLRLHTALQDNMKKYVVEYHNSFVKTGDRVLKLLAPNEHSKFVACGMSSDEGFSERNYCMRKLKWKNLEEATADKEFLEDTFVICHDKKIAYRASKLSASSDPYVHMENNILFVRTIHIRHSCFHRSYNPQIRSKHASISIFDMTKNVALLAGYFSLHGAYSGYCDDDYQDYSAMEMAKNSSN